jgi:hypothetical protein
VDVFETAELATVVVVIAGLLLYWMLSWWGSRPAKGRRVRDIVRRPLLRGRPEWCEIGAPGNIYSAVRYAGADGGDLGRGSSGPLPVGLGPVAMRQVAVVHGSEVTHIVGATAALHEDVVHGVRARSPTQHAPVPVALEDGTADRFPACRALPPTRHRPRLRVLITVAPVPDERGAAGIRASTWCAGHRCYLTTAVPPDTTAPITGTACLPA